MRTVDFSFCNAGEATRLLAWLVKNSQSSDVMRLIIRAEGIPHLVSMMTSEHVVMQNEALVALTLITTAVLGKCYKRVFEMKIEVK